MICHYPAKKSTFSDFLKIPGDPARLYPHPLCSLFHHNGYKFREGMKINGKKGTVQQNSGGERKFHYLSLQGRSGR